MDARPASRRPRESIMDDDPATIHRELRMIDLGDGLDPAAREARLTAAARAYEDARIDGLCHDGAWELALAALRGPAVDSEKET